MSDQHGSKLARSAMPLVGLSKLLLLLVLSTRLDQAAALVVRVIAGLAAVLDIAAIVLIWRRR